MASQTKEKSFLIEPKLGSHYDPRFIDHVVKEISAGLPQGAALVKYGLKRGTLTTWLYNSSRYHFERTKTPSPPASTKRSIVRAIREGRMTLQEAKASCKLKSVRTIHAWMAWEQRENADLSCSNQSTMAREKTEKKDTPLAPTVEELAELRQALADEKLRTAALNTLIDVAEEQLKINIRKKPGAKQS